MAERKPIRVFSVNLTGAPEFYATAAYRLRDNGIAEMTGKTHDVTKDILPHLEAAKVATVKDLVSEIETQGLPDESGATEDAMIAWLRSHIVIEDPQP